MKDKYKELILPVISLIILLLVVTESYFSGRVPTESIMIYYGYLLRLSSLINGVTAFLQPLFIIVPMCFIFSRKYKNGYIKNELTRLSYKQYLKNRFKDILKVIWIFPAFYLLVFIFSCFQSNVLTISGDVIQYSTAFDFKYFNNLPLMFIIYFFRLIAHSFFYACLAMISCKKNQNFAVSVVMAYVSYLGCAIISEIFIAGILISKILGIHGFSVLFSLIDPFVIGEAPSIFCYPVFDLALMIISTIMVLYAYKKKEEVIVCSEE